MSLIYEKYLEQWIKGISSEYRYWNNYFMKEHDSEIYQTRVSENPKFADMEIMNDVIQNCLDVGSGPISTLGNRVLNRTIDLVAVDPLANLYNLILQKNNIIPYCRTQFALSECLSDFFMNNQFDLIYMRNALDHSILPMNSVLQMLYIVKNGSNVVLFHRINEAERRSYGGFHQWNINVDNDILTFWNKSEVIHVNKHLDRIADIKIFEEKDGDFDAIKVIITKKAEMNKPETLTSQFCKTIFSYFCRFTLEREDLRKKVLNR